MTIRGDCGLVLSLFPLVVRSTSSVEVEEADEVVPIVEADAAESVEAVRDRAGCDSVVQVDFSSDSSNDFSDVFSPKLNLELVPVTGLIKPVDMDFKKSR